MPKLGLGFQAMDSPETAKLTTCSASDSPPVQDSPFFNFISNLSPITHVRSTHATRELSRLNSPPIVFKSPRRKQHSETNILKRSYSLQLSSPLEPQSINRGKECIDGPVDTEQFISQNGLIAETLKGCDVAGSSETHPSSSSGCVDEFLADPGEADSVSSAKSATPTLKQSNDACASYRSGSRESKETIFKFDNKNGMWMDTEANLEALLVSSENADKDIQGSESGAKSTEIEEEQKDAEWPSYTCQNITTSFPVVASFNKQSRQNLESQGIEFEHHNDRECASQPSPDRFPAQTYEDHSEDGDGISEGPVENIMRKGHKASENQRGVRRRCLQFEEAPSCTIRYGDSSSNLASTVSSSKQPTSSNLGAFKSSHAESNVTSETMINLPQSAPTLSHTRSCENISMASKPLGIGLHLNSIVNAVSLGCTTTAGKKSTDHHMGVGGIKSRMPENTKSCFVSLSVIEKDSASNEERIDSAKPLSLASSVTNQFSHMVEDLYPALDENGKSKPQNADRFEENDQPSPRKKRKKATSLGDDGCKRCNCKKTKCLKLYCDCFAAGVYCTDPCACQGCFNRPEYKDTVLETRGQIESRNPLAFAPKIVQRISELPPNNGEDGNRSTPSSARHKRGCNCKRSMCLKKYCECYQANVGCSSGCRCEGCKNVFGKKEEYVAMEHGVTREKVGDIACEEQLETTFDKELEMAELRRDLLCTELIIPHNLTPLTPSFQHSDHGKNAPKSRLLSKRHLPSPDSNHSVLSSYNKPMKSPPGDVENGGILLKTCEALQNEGSRDMQADYNMGKSGSISSRCNVVSNAHYSTEMSDPPIPIILQRRRDCVSVSQSQQCPENDSLLSRSLTRHGSPLTPMTRLGGTKPNQGPDSACELIDILEGDGTPVKVSSPNKKRVSPPHSRIYKLGSGSSVGLRSGRKFILKSVPSFPPLTPCIDSKGSSTSQNRDKLQDNDSVKEQDNDSIKK